MESQVNVCYLFQSYVRRTYDYNRFSRPWFKRRCSHIKVEQPQVVIKQEESNLVAQPEVCHLIEDDKLLIVGESDLGEHQIFDLQTKQFEVLNNGIRWGRLELTRIHLQLRKVRTDRIFLHGRSDPHSKVRPEEAYRTEREVEDRLRQRLLQLQQKRADLQRRPLLHRRV